MSNEAAHIRPLLPSLISSPLSAGNESNETTSEDHTGLSLILCSGNRDELIPDS